MPPKVLRTPRDLRGRPSDSLSLAPAAGAPASRCIMAGRLAPASGASRRPGSFRCEAAFRRAPTPSRHGIPLPPHSGVSASATARCARSPAPRHPQTARPAATRAANQRPPGPPTPQHPKSPGPAHLRSALQTAGGTPARAQSGAAQLPLRPQPARLLSPAPPRSCKSTVRQLSYCGLIKALGQPCMLRDAAG